MGGVGPWRASENAGGKLWCRCMEFVGAVVVLLGDADPGVVEEVLKEEVLEMEVGGGLAGKGTAGVLK